MTGNEIKLLLVSVRQEALQAFVNAAQDSKHSKLRYLQGHIHSVDNILNKIQELEAKEKNANDD